MKFARTFMRAFVGTAWIACPIVDGVEIRLAAESPMLAFAAEALEEVAAEGDGSAGLVDSVTLTTLESLPDGVVPPVGLQPEGFEVRWSGSSLRVIGADDAGAMYGGLELAEIARTQGWNSIEARRQNPYMAMRGAKFNIPLDVRTPSYTDVSDAAQANIAEMWNFDFWRTYIDELARHRYNFVSLWSLHPFPSMVRVPGYEEVALDNVKRSTVDWDESYQLTGIGFDAPEIVNNAETLLELTIEEKVDFWRRVMQYGKERNVHFYVVTWNTFVYGTEGKYGITDSLSNETTRDYFRKSVKQMFTTYPDLRGIGLTTGENMGGYSFQEKEDWAFDTYGKGVLDAAAEMPGRKIAFIHRQHQTGAQDIARTFQPLIEDPDIEFIFSFKYAKAHVYSSTTQPYHEGFVDDIGDLKTIWTLRNDDVFHFRWGAPDFVREFMQNIPHEVSRGYYYGSDQYVWGREFMSLEPEYSSGANERQLELEKHWYQWLLWGRLGYDPDLGNDRLAAMLDRRFEEADGKALFDAWQVASMAYPITTGFHWGALDFQWYIEACQSIPGAAETPTGFHDINRFISLDPHPSREFMSIPEFVDATLSDSPMSGPTPFEVSERLIENAEKALDYVEEQGRVSDKELRLTLEDIESIAYLGRYYGYKIRGAAELALFRETGNLGHQAACQKAMITAAASWRRYVSLAASNYENPLWTNRVGYVDWRKSMRSALYDLTMVGAEHELPPFRPTQGGVIYEAEEGKNVGLRFENEVEGFTGSGYLSARGAKPEAKVEWIIDAPQAGAYTLEFRYTLARQSYQTVELELNGEFVRDLKVWPTGARPSWSWDRAHVTLEAGRNRLVLHPSRALFLDHVNVLERF